MHVRESTCRIRLSIEIAWHGEVYQARSAGHEAGQIRIVDITDKGGGGGIATETRVAALVGAQEMGKVSEARIMADNHRR